MNLPQDKHLINKVASLPLLLAHELCHYTVARALGIRAKLGLGHLSLKPDNLYGWKMFVVMLAPALAGVVGLVFLVGLSIMRQRPLAIWVSLFLALYWWGMCLDDFYCLFYYTKHKKWPSSLQKKPKPGLAGIKVLAEWRPWEENAGQTKIRSSNSQSNSLIELLKQKHNEGYKTTPKQSRSSEVGSFGLLIAKQALDSYHSSLIFIGAPHEQITFFRR